MIRVLLLVLVCVACGNKGNDKAAKEIDQYINHDYAPHLAKVIAARSAYGDIKADDITEKPALVRYRIHDVALPFLAQAVEGLASLTPPARVKQWHTDELSALVAERDAIAELEKNLDNPEGFKAAHIQMMEAQEAVMASERARVKLLADYNVKLADLPKVEIPKQQAQAPVPTSNDPPQCKPSTAKRAADDYVTCETELMFSPPETPASTPRESVVACGPGELVIAPSGAIVSCISFGKLKIGETDIPKAAKITFGDKAHVMKAEPPDGKPLCFDDKNATVPCP